MIIITKQSYNLIDIVKFVASILILTMHCNAFGDFGYIGLAFEIIARWGVPFFFIASSFFLFGKSVDGNIKKDTLQRYLKRIFLLYLVWLCINLPSVIYSRITSDSLMSLSAWLITLKGYLLSSTFTGSWYLASSLFSAFFIYVLSKKFNTKAVLAITFPIYVICILTSVYRGLLPERIATALSFLHFPLNIFNGCFYFTVGKYIVENKEKLLNIFSKVKCLILFAAFYFFYLIELFVARRFNILGSTDVSFSIIGVAFFLFLFCIQTPVSIKHSVLFRKLSTIVYCSQGNVLLINTLCKAHIESLFVTYLISLSIVAIICILVLLLQKKSHWKWVTYLT